MKALYILVFLFVCMSLHSQVGIDNPNPDSKAILDMQSTSKGVLIPRLFTSERLALASGAPEGLMVYDKDLHAFYYYYNSDWLCITPWTLKHSTATTPQDMIVNTSLVDAVGINTTPLSGEKLAVGGNLRVDSDVKTATITASGVVTSTANATFNTSNSNKKFSADGVSGFSGPVPPGFIGFWSGAISGNFNASGLGLGKLLGWALCNGNNGTPDLRDRFVVGAGAAYSVGSEGGVDSVKLSEAQIPAHNHTGMATVDGYHDHVEGGGHEWAQWGWAGIDQQRNTGSDPGGLPKTAAGGSHTHVLSINDTGGGKYHENRPPYYALAYIMKL